jgi:hypothetical protein
MRNALLLASLENRAESFLKSDAVFEKIKYFFKKQQRPDRFLQRASFEHSEKQPVVDN